MLVVAIGVLIKQVWLKTKKSRYSDENNDFNGKLSFSFFLQMFPKNSQITTWFTNRKEITLLLLLITWTMMLLFYSTYLSTRHECQNRSTARLKIKKELNQIHHEDSTLDNQMERKSILQNNCQLKSKADVDNSPRFNGNNYFKWKWNFKACMFSEFQNMYSRSCLMWSLWARTKLIT